MTKENSVYVIIVTYNGEKWIESCLRSIYNGTIIPNVIVVDNCSKDGTVHIISSKFPDSIILKMVSNKGFGSANNIGIQEAIKRGAEYLFLMNQDVYLFPDTIQKLLNAHKCSEEYWLMSPIHLNGNGKDLDQRFKDNLRECGVEMLRDFLLQKGNEKRVYGAQYVNGAAWLLPKKTIHEIGLFDPLFFLYGEDDNYLHRIHFKKGKVGIYTGAYIMHDRENRLKSNLKNKTLEKLIFLEKNKLLVRLLNINNNLPRIISLEAAILFAAIYGLLRGKLIIVELYAIIISYGMILSKAWSIKKHRKVCRIGSAFYMNKNKHSHLPTLS